MEEARWMHTFSSFQARARGYLVRSELRRARKDFEDVVTETDGVTTHLKWIERLISLPHFTDTAGSHLHRCCTGRKTLHATGDVSACAQCLVVSSEDGELCSKAEDDGSCHAFPTCPLSGAGVRQRLGALGDTWGPLMGNTTKVSTKWSPSDLDLIYDQPHKGPSQNCLVQEVPPTKEALHLHRNILNMELLWIQQAIDSRKKYLSLKESVS